jgi:hypothetical protein
MRMLPFFLIFAPGLLSAAIHRALKQKPVSNFDFLVSAVIYAFFIAAFAFGVIYLRGFGDLSPLAVFDNLRSVAKYCTISAVSAVALPTSYSWQSVFWERENAMKRKLGFWPLLRGILALVMLAAILIVALWPRLSGELVTYESVSASSPAAEPSFGDTIRALLAEFSAQDATDALIYRSFIPAHTPPKNR